VNTNKFVVQFPLLEKLFHDRDTSGRNSVPTEIMTWMNEQLAPSGNYGLYYKRPPKDVPREDNTPSLLKKIEMVHAGKILPEVWNDDQSEIGCVL
jgi:hypothetical protein